MTGASKSTLCLDSCELTTQMKTLWWLCMRHRFLSDSLCLRKARCRAVMSRPQLGCSGIPNTESTPGVESGKQYPGTDHKIVNFAPVRFSGTLVKLAWLLLVHVRNLFLHPSWQSKYFPFTGQEMAQICVLLLHSIFCKCMLIKINVHDPNKRNRE